MLIWLGCCISATIARIFSFTCTSVVLHRSISFTHPIVFYFVRRVRCCFFFLFFLFSTAVRFVKCLHFSIVLSSTKCICACCAVSTICMCVCLSLVISMRPYLCTSENYVDYKNIMRAVRIVVPEKWKEKLIKKKVIGLAFGLLLLLLLYFPEKCKPLNSVCVLFVSMYSCFIYFLFYFFISRQYSRRKVRIYYVPKKCMQRITKGRCFLRLCRFVACLMYSGRYLTCYCNMTNACMSESEEIFEVSG